MTCCIGLPVAHDATQVGQKASGLQKAISLGLQVPNGFAISRRALTSILEYGDLLKHLNLLESSALSLSGAEFAAEVASFEAEFKRAPAATELRQEVEAMAIPLFQSSASGLAVRSSGVCEDTANASFAGIYESYLGVTTLDELWDAIRKCWLSSWSQRAFLYSKRMGVAALPDQMAVIVQHTVPADCSGVVFTADPVSGNPWRVIINSTFGLSEDLLRSNSAGDRFVLDWRSGEILEKNIAAKKTTLAVVDERIRVVENPSETANAPSLSVAQAREVCCLAIGLDNALNTRVDVEWAFSSGHLYVLQVRPITALPEFFPNDLSGEDAELTWTLQVDDWVRSVVDGEKLVAPFYQHVFSSELWGRHQPTGDGYNVFLRAQAREMDTNGYRYVHNWEWSGPWNDYRDTEPWLDVNEPELRADWERRLLEIRSSAVRTISLLEGESTATELIPELLALRDLAFDMEAASFAAPQSLGGICQGYLQKVIDAVAPGFPIGDLLQGIRSESYEKTFAVQKLCESIDSDEVRDLINFGDLNDIVPSLQRCPRADSFLKTYRQVCLAHGIPTPKTRKENDQSRSSDLRALLLIRNTLLGRSRNAEETFAQLAAARGIAEADLRSRVKILGEEHLLRFNKLLKWTQFWNPALDDRACVGNLLGTLKEFVLHVGELLVEECVLDSASDILLLSTSDLEFFATHADPGARRGLFLQRKGIYEQNRRLTPPSGLGKRVEHDNTAVIHQGSEPQKEPIAVGSLLKGTGIAPGVRTGTARRMEDLMDTENLKSLAPGDILVATNEKLGCYADWFSLLLTLEGLVTTWGDYLHHTTQLCRELSVAYVNLLPEYANSIRDGSRIRINGATGKVEILDS